MKHICVGMKFPLVGLVLKDKSSFAGVPVGFRSDEEHFYLIYPFAEVNLDDVVEIATYDHRGEPHKVPVNCGAGAQIMLWRLNQEFTE